MVDQSGPIKDWFKKTFAKLGTRKHNHPGHLVGVKGRQKDATVKENNPSFIDEKDEEKRASSVDTFKKYNK